MKIFTPILFTTGVYFLLSISPCLAASSKPSVICKKNTTGTISIRVGKCKGSETKLSNITLLTGPTGATGANGTNGVDGTNGTNGTDGTNGSDGANGSLRVYGDGSAGALTVSSYTTLDAANLQYTDVTITPSGTLNLASGTVIRCTGTFTNDGTVSTSSFAGGAYIASGVGSLGSSPNIATAAFGNARAAGSQGAFGTSATNLAGGASGLNLDNASATMLLHPGPGGGSGGGAAIGSFGGATGGGTLTVIASGAIVNNGQINAKGTAGDSGGGGGGGGIVILASKTSVTNAAAGIIDVSGGRGGDSNSSSGGGGGGGGGFIHLLSPTTPVDLGTLNYDGGTAGSNATAVTASPRMGGPGGGSCSGSGGSGSAVSSGNVSSGNSAGGTGASFLTTADPTSLM